MTQIDRIPGVPEATADCWFVTGPTAAGKTRVGLALAQRIDGEILSLDSMALYRGMDIGTAKPTAEQRALVPHRLLDLVDPTEEFSLAQYLTHAVRAVEAIRSRGKQPIFVGGTPLYLKALLRGVFEGPPADRELRQALEAEAEEFGSEALHERLALVDPLSASKLHPHDTRRIVRALEVYRATGQPISHLQLQFDDGRPSGDRRAYWLAWDRNELHRRIEERVDRMIEQGLVQETRGLLDRFGELSRTALQAVGYRELIAHFRGGSPLPETIETIKIRTRQFARRQETWFRSLKELRRIELSAKKSPDAIAEEIVQLAGSERRT